MTAAVTRSYGPTDGSQRQRGRLPPIAPGDVSGAVTCTGGFVTTTLAVTATCEREAWIDRIPAHRRETRKNHQMELTSEQVHHVGGAAFTLVAGLLLLWHLRVLQGSWLPLTMPGLLILYGIESFADRWIHGAQLPSSYEAEGLQHLIQGGVVTVAGIIEGLILLGKLRHPVWRGAVPVALGIIGVVFLVHAQHDVNVDPLVLAVQHRIFAVTLFVAGAAKALSETRGETTRWLNAGWLLPMLVFGLELLMYSEGSGGHSGAGPH